MFVADHRITRYLLPVALDFELTVRRPDKFSITLLEMAMLILLARPLYRLLGLPARPAESVILSDTPKELPAAMPVVAVPRAV